MSSHAQNLPYPEGMCNRIRNNFQSTLTLPVSEKLSYVKTSKEVLWQSVSALMKKAYGEENLTRLARDCKFGPGTSVRLREQKTSVGSDIIDKIAKQFGVEPWMLLVPTFDPENIPTLKPVTEQELRFYARVKEALSELKEEEPK